MWTAIEKAERARKEVALLPVRSGAGYPVVLPDMSTKAKARQVAGWDRNAWKADKKDLLETTAAEWDKIARE
jgi:nitrite reductase (cytochrome c-552)